MNKKAIIFTLDALIALSIFVAVAIAMYSVLSPKPEINIQSSAIYMNSENFLRASDKAENFSQAFLNIQEGDTAAATAILQNLLEELPYPAEMRLSVYNESGNLVSNLTVNDQNFTTSIILRKFLVLSITENLATQNAQFMDINVGSSKVSDVQNFDIVLKPDQTKPIPQQVNPVMPNVYDAYGQPQSWTIMPTFPVPPEAYFADHQSQPVTLHYTMSIPSSASIGEYRMNAVAAGSNYNQIESASFNVITYGVIELEVQTS